jgi:hypothetical protein
MPDDSADVAGLVDQEQVAASGHDVKSGAGDPPGKEASVGERDQGVVVAGQHERLLVQLPEPRRARPPRHREQLGLVAPE